MSGPDAFRSVDDDVDGLEQLARRFLAPHADANGRRTVRGELLEHPERRKVPDVVADEAHRTQSCSEFARRGALVHVDRWVELERHPRRTHGQPRTLGQMLRERLDLRSRLRAAAIVHRER